MWKRLWLVTWIVATGAGGAAAEGWDHRGMQSHHQAVERSEPALAPGEVRIGRITIGAPAPERAAVPDTLEQSTQRQWTQRASFEGAKAGGQAFHAPPIQASRNDGTPRGSGGAPGSSGRKGSRSTPSR
jgi:hypothetical protein